MTIKLTKEQKKILDSTSEISVLLPRKYGRTYGRKNIDDLTF